MRRPPFEGGRRRHCIRVDPRPGRLDGGLLRSRRYAVRLRPFLLSFPIPSLFQLRGRRTVFSFTRRKSTCPRQHKPIADSAVPVSASAVPEPQPGSWSLGSCHPRGRPSGEGSRSGPSRARVRRTHLMNPGLCRASSAAAPSRTLSLAFHACDVASQILPVHRSGPLRTHEIPVVRRPVRPIRPRRSALRCTNANAARGPLSCFRKAPNSTSNRHTWTAIDPASRRLMVERAKAAAGWAGPYEVVSLDARREAAKQASNAAGPGYTAEQPPLRRSDSVNPPHSRPIVGIPALPAASAS